MRFNEIAKRTGRAVALSAALVAAASLTLVPGTAYAQHRGGGGGGGFHGGGFHGGGFHGGGFRGGAFHSGGGFRGGRFGGGNFHGGGFRGGRFGGRNHGFSNDVFIGGFGFPAWWGWDYPYGYYGYG